jgi:hypothetical protein
MPSWSANTRESSPGTKLPAMRMVAPRERCGIGVGQDQPRIDGDAARAISEERTPAWRRRPVDR